MAVREEGLDDDLGPSVGSARALLVGVVVLVWLAVQIAVPAMRLIERGGGPRPRTFGWQMFSHQLTGPAESFTVTTADGTRPVPVEDLLDGPMRREILYAPTIVAELCRDPAVLAVTVTDVEWGVSETRCR